MKALLLSLPALLTALPAAAEVQFNRDIRPLLSENCLQCHGPDPGSRKAGLRLDTKEGFFEKTEDRGPTVVAGKPDESPLFQRLITTDPDDLMPPPESHKELKPEQKELIRQWITEGASWQPHWAFLKPERPPVPTPAAAPQPVRNPIDSFVFAKLQEKGLQPAREADRATLARRLSLDLTGLPPSPGDVAAFAADQSPDYYEKYVQKLMASPHYGEHRGRYWLDAARYGDTHGLHFDNYREMWPYRDWVIAAFNRNLPFDQFTTEQIAGDLLPQPTLDQQVATGFHRCNITTNEGGTIVEENLANYARDRVETTSWVWLGLTANCAVCHDHKFDPLSTKDFYSMEAYFRNTTQPGLDGNVKDSSPAIIVPQTEEDQNRWAAIPGEIEAKQQSIARRREEAKGAFDGWLASARAADLGDGVRPEGLIAHAPLTEGVGDEIGAICGQPMRFKATGPVSWKPDGRIGPAPVLNAATSFDLGDQGDFEKDQAFSYGAWVRAAGNNAYASMLARMDEGNNYRGWDLWQNGDRFAVHLVNAWPGNAIKVQTRPPTVKPGEWQHFFMTYDGSGKAGGIRLFINGRQVETRVEADTLTETIRTTVPLKIGQRSAGQFFEGGSVQDVRVYARRLEAAEVESLHNTGPLRAMLAIDPGKRTPEQQQALYDFYLTTMDPPSQQLRTELAGLEQERNTIRERSPVTHIQEEKRDSTPMAHILFRGNYDQPREKVEPAVFSALHPLPDGAPRNRLGLAQWLNSPENPLTARVTVNRFWQELFGTGIVKTAEDFGIVGDPPSNQALLDWLAVEFRGNGWDIRKLLMTIVTSSVYRQEAVTTPEKLEKDRDNRLLSRGPRFRMDAEVIRDSALAASGLLVPKIGGPSVKPYQPEGIWDKVGMIEGNTRIYQQDKGENLYRRSLYSFWKRMAPPASLEIFNAPAREISCLRRERTNTPLQALAALNDVQLLEAARVLSEKAMREAGASFEETLGFLTARVLSRCLSPEETAIVRQTHEAALAAFRERPEDAARFIRQGETVPDAKLDPAQLAAWLTVSNQIMNLDEALNK
jgi:mono/diheme cytochrome c family protein